MKVNRILLLIAVPAMIASVIISYWYISGSHSSEIVTFKVAYMNYACGDCYPQYQIREIIAAKKDYSYLKGVNINVHFVNEELEAQIERKTEHCYGCYHYVVEGILDSSSKGYSLEAANVQIIGLFYHTDSVAVHNQTQSKKYNVGL